MQDLKPPPKAEQKIEKKQIVLILACSLILVVALIILFLQKTHNTGAVDSPTADSVQSETLQADEEIQTSLEDYCAADLAKLCKDLPGTKAFTCLKESVDKLESSCADFIKGEQ